MIAATARWHTFGRLPLPVKESFPRPRNPAAVVARRENAPAEPIALDGEIAQTRARLEKLLAKAEPPETQEASASGAEGADRIDARNRRFRPKSELAPEKAPEAGAAESAVKPTEGAVGKTPPATRVEKPVDASGREIAPPPPRESVPPEFRAPEPDADAPKPAPFWSEAEPSTTAQVAGRWEQRNELRRIPNGLWGTFIVTALVVGAGLGWILRGAPPEAPRTATAPAAAPTPAPQPVAAPVSPSFPAVGEPAGLIRYRKPANDILTSPSMAKFNEAAQAEAEGKFEEAGRLYAEAATLTPRAPGTSLRLGFVSARRGDLAAATEHFKRAVEAGEGAAMAASQLALMHADLKSWEAAEQWALVTIGLEPARGRHYLLWGDFARRQGLATQGIARYQMAQRRELDQAELSALRVRIALAELERGNAEALDKFLGSANPEQRKVPDWSMMSAAAALRRGENEAAAEHLKAARAGYSLPMGMLHAKDVFFAEYFARPGAGAILRDMAAGTPKEPR